jgi:hypothetical protein
MVKLLLMGDCQVTHNWIFLMSWNGFFYFLCFVLCRHRARCDFFFIEGMFVELIDCYYKYFLLMICCGQSFWLGGVAVDNLCRESVVSGGMCFFSVAMMSQSGGRTTMQKLVIRGEFTVHER